MSTIPQSSFPLPSTATANSSLTSSSKPPFISSKANAIRSTLIAAWRTKLSNEEWEAKIRKVIPNGLNGDVYDLANCILDQALISPVPNYLFISYLKHAINAKLVSHGVLLSSIYQQFENEEYFHTSTLSILCILNLLDELKDTICCSGNESDCISFCKSLTLLNHWLFKCIKFSLHQICNSSPQFLLESISQPTNTHQQQLGSNVNLRTANQTQQHSTSIDTDHINVVPNFPFLNQLKIINQATNLIGHLVSKPFFKALLFISKIEFKQELNELNSTVQAVYSRFPQDSHIKTFLSETIKTQSMRKLLDQTILASSLHPTIIAAQQLRCIAHNLPRPSSTTLKLTTNQDELARMLRYHDFSTSQALFDMLYSIIAFEAILKPARSVKLLARRIALATNFISAPMHKTYCELIRICMIGFIDANGTPDRVKWANFTFLKLPKLLRELSKLKNGNFYYQDDISLIDCVLPNNNNNNYNISINASAAQTNSGNSFFDDLKLALQILYEYSPLLEDVDYKCNCDFFSCFIKELVKLDQALMPLKSFADNLSSLTKKQNMTSSLTSNSTSSPSDSSFGFHVIIKTEPIVTTMLKTLDSEQNPSELFAILSQLVSGKQFEFTLSAAASTDRLETFIRSLIRHNETNRNLSKIETANTLTCTNVAADNAHRALTFDLTFLMLTYIANQYGPEVMLNQDKSSFFIKWYNDCYNCESRINCPKQMLRNCDTSITRILINQLIEEPIIDGSNDSSKVISNGISLEGFEDLSVVCTNIPNAVCDILNSWQRNEISEVQIKCMIEKLKSKLCSLAIIVACWLQAFIRTLPESKQVRPLIFLQGFTRSSQQAKRQLQFFKTDNTVQQQQPSMNIKSESYSERSSLMCSLIRKIYFELKPSVISSNILSNSSLHPQAANPVSQVDLNTTNTVSKSDASTLNSSGQQTTCNESEENQQQSNQYQQLQLPVQSQAPKNEVTHQYINKMFISTLWSYEILKENVRKCIVRGWIDLKSLHSLNSVFSIVGVQCFTDFMVDYFMTSWETPSELNRGVNICFSLFNLNIEECANALFKETIFSYLLNGKKQDHLNQPRILALARLSVMTIFSAINHLKALCGNETDLSCGSSDGGSNIYNNSFSSSNNHHNIVGRNEMKTQLGENGFSTTNSALGTNSVVSMEVDTNNSVSLNNSLDNPVIPVKRIKCEIQEVVANESTDIAAQYRQQQQPNSINNINVNNCFSDSTTKNDYKERLNKLDEHIKRLMILIAKITCDSNVTKRTLFPLLFLQQVVYCSRLSSSFVTKHLQPETLLDIIKIYSSELSFDLALAYGNTFSQRGRRVTAQAMCQLACIQQQQQQHQHQSKT